MRVLSAGTALSVPGLVVAGSPTQQVPGRTPDVMVTDERVHTPRGCRRLLPGTKLWMTHDVEVGQEAILPRVQDQGSLQLLHCEPIPLQAQGTFDCDVGRHGSVSNCFFDRSSYKVMPWWQRHNPQARSRQLGSTVSGLPQMHWRRNKAELVWPNVLVAAALPPCKNGLSLLHRRRASASLCLQPLAFVL